MPPRSLRVAFVSLDLASASARVRIHDHTAGLGELGVSVEAHDLPRGLLARRRLFRGFEDVDAVVLHRVLLGETDMVPLRRRARALVLDMDDAVHQRPFGASTGVGLRKKFAVTLRACDLVMCGNLHLREQLQGRHSRVRLLPPASASPAEVPARTPGDRVRLVWTGSQATLPYLERLGAVLEAVADEVLLEVLADEAPKLPPAVEVRFTPWTLEAEEEVLTRAEIGLYPLAGDLWSEGKCAYKLHRYMQFGLPSVASSHGAGREVLVGGEAGILADTAAEWEAALRRLAADPALRRRMGLAARSLAAGTHSLQDRTRALAGILREAAAIGRFRRAGAGPKD